MHFDILAFALAADLERDDAEKWKKSLDLILKLLAESTESDKEILYFQVAKRMEHADEQVQHRSVLALHRICNGERGNEYALKNIIPKLNHNRASVRKEAVTALGFMGIKGNEEHLKYARDALVDEDDMVRMVAQWTAAQLIENDKNPEHFQQTLQLLKSMKFDNNNSSNISSSALVATLTNLSHDVENPEQIDVLLTMLCDSNRDLRENAVRGLVELKQRNSDKVLKALEHACQHQYDEYVRRDALSALPLLFDRGNVKALFLATNMSEDVDALVRKESITSMLAMMVLLPVSTSSSSSSVTDGDSGVVPLGAECILAKTTDSIEVVRLEALKAVGTIFEGRGTMHVIDTVAARIGDADIEIRDYAVKTLIQVAVMDDTRVITALSKLMMTDGRPQVRQEAVLALIGVCSKNNEHVLTLVGGLLSDADLGVRSAAIATLMQMADLDNDVVVTAATQLLSSPKVPIRKTAIMALAKLCSRGNAAIILKVISQLTHRSPEIRIATLQSLTQISDWRNNLVEMAVNTMINNDVDENVIREAKLTAKLLGLNRNT